MTFVILYNEKIIVIKSQAKVIFKVHSRNTKETLTLNLEGF
jgi:hypothetical protein